MRITLLLILCVLPFSTFAVERAVIVRNSADKLIIKKEKLDDLLSKTHYEGRFFKIVEGTSSDAIEIDNSEVSRKAANVYYHLTKAKRFFERIGKIQDEQITIRIDIKNAFHKMYHFQNVNLNPVYNNAGTVIGGEGIEEYGVKPWGNEIWFRPGKRKPVDKNFKKKFRKLVRNSIPRRNNFSADVLLFTAIDATITESPLESLENSGRTILENYLTSTLLRVAVPELLLVFSKKYFYFESAFIPEVIYHEYTHYAMSENLSPIINTTLLEGFADFFAAKISNRTKIAHKLGDYASLVASRSALSKDLYSLGIDTKAGLGNDFVLSLFYEISEMLSKKENEVYALKTLFNLHKHLSLDTHIGKDFPDIFWKIIPDYRLEAMMILHQRGI